MTIATGKSLGPYEITGALGEGGMGEVYRARDSRLDREVAIKVLPQHLSKDVSALARFEREAKAIAALSHPNILTIFDFGNDDGVAFLVTELLEGETLRDRLSMRGMTWPEALNAAIALAAGLAAAHAKGIVHRDLKPENIFVTRADVVKILDFGLARVSDAFASGQNGGRTLPMGNDEIGPQTTPGMVLGTLGYMSPEQARGQTADARSDIFSAGCVIYEMLSGRPPFKRDTAADTLVAILNENPPSPAREGVDVPQPLVEIAGRCLRKSAAERFESAGELHSALAELQRGAIGLMPPMAAPALPTQPTPTPSDSLWAPTSQSPATVGLAVLPLENLSGDPEQEFFADGMTDALISDLAKIGSLRVISRRSVMPYKGVAKSLKDIAEELKVAYLVEGTVIRSGGRARIAAQLIEAASETMIWSETYEHDLSDILVLQREVARAVAEEVRVKLTPGEQEALETPTEHLNPEAHEYGLRGAFFMHESVDQFPKAKTCFEEAIRIDPNYARGHAGLAMLYGLFGMVGAITTREAVEQSRSYGQRALELDDSLAEAHLALASIKLHYDWEWDASEREFRRARELNPGSSDVHHFYSRFLNFMGRADEALREIDQAENLDPRSFPIKTAKAVILRDARRYDDSIVQCERILALNAAEVMPIFVQGVCYREKGMYPQAIAALERAVRLAKSSSGYAAHLAIAYIRDGREDEARTVLADLQTRGESGYVLPAHLALIHASLGEKDEAFECLERAFEERSDIMAALKVNSGWDPIRDDPRFIDLLRRVGHKV